MNKHFNLLILSCFFITQSLFAQVPQDTIYSFLTSTVTSKAEFTGGTAAMYKFIGDKIQISNHALECGNNCTYLMRFVIEKDGSVNNVSIHSTTCKAPPPTYGSKKERKKKYTKRIRKGLPVILPGKDGCSNVCDDMAASSMKVVKSMPNWQPALLNDAPVRMEFLLPIKFQLN